MCLSMILSKEYYYIDIANANQNSDIFADKITRC